MSGSRSAAEQLLEWMVEGREDVEDKEAGGAALESTAAPLTLLLFQR